MEGHSVTVRPVRGPSAPLLGFVGLVSVSFGGVSSAPSFWTRSGSDITLTFSAGGGLASLVVSGAKTKVGTSAGKCGVFVFIPSFSPDPVSFLFTMVGALEHCGSGE